MIESHLAYSLSAAHKSVNQSLANRAKVHGIQIEAWRVLEALDADEKLTMGNLATIVLMNPSALSKLVDRMVSDGLVHRKIAQEDQRQVHLHLTALGQKRMLQVREQAMELDQSIREILGEDKTAALQDMLATLAQHKA